MGTYSRTVEARLDDAALALERTRVLSEIRDLRGGRPLLVLAGRAGAGEVGALGDPDLLLVEDRLDELEGAGLDLLLEVPGGAPAAAERILRVLRGRVREFSVLVPGRVAPAGGLLALGADELLLAGSGGLAPLLADPPDLLRGLAPEALGMGRLVPPDRTPQELAAALTSRERLLSADRTLDAAALGALGLDVVHLGRDEALGRALVTYHALLAVTFERGTAKLVETPEGRVARAAPRRASRSLPVLRLAPRREGGGNGAAAGAGEATASTGNMAIIEVRCNCGTHSKIQANLGISVGLQDGHWAFPADDQFYCPDCMSRSDLSSVRRQIEEQTQKKVVG